MLAYLFPLFLLISLAILHERNFFKANNKTYALALFLMGVFSGSRFETGYDWQSYKEYFELINLEYLDIYPENYNFEIGFFFLNYLVKLSGGNYLIIPLFASLFLAYALYEFTKNFKGNKFYILTIYLCTTYLSINFASLRQSIAIGFFILGCSQYIRNQNKIKSLIISSFGIFFQISSLIYVSVMALIFCFNKNNTKRLLFFYLAIISIFYLGTFTNLTLVQSFFPNFPYIQKIIQYKNHEANFKFLHFYLVYLFFISIYIWSNLSSAVKSNYEFILHYAFLIILVTILFSIAFPKSYIFYSRTYQVAAIFQAYALALIFYSKKGKFDIYIFWLSIIFSLAYYFRTLLVNKDVFIPYRTFFNF
jgi:hypothetical protein